MQARFCLVLVLVVLVGAMLTGNPFLRASRRPTGGPLAGEAPVRHGEGHAGDSLSGWPLVATPVAAPAERQAGPQADTVEDTVAREAGLEGLGEIPGADQCPDVSLRQLVVDVHTDPYGARIWRLRDGRILQRNPRLGAGQPLLVPVLSAVEKHEKQSPR